MKILFIIIISIFLFGCSDSPTKSENENKIELVSINDYQFLSNQYFFVDHYYRDRFESGYSEYLNYFIWESGKSLSQVYVWISTNNFNDSYSGVASVDPEYYKNLDYQSIEEIEGQVVKSRFRLLNEYEYEVDYFRGFIVLKNKISDSEILGISYIQSDGNKVGTVLGDEIDVIHCNLIKPKFQTEFEDYVFTWPLMMRNVYFLGDMAGIYTLFDLDNIEITNVLTNKTESITDPPRTYLYLLGLDLGDDYGRIGFEFGDNVIDKNPLLFDEESFILIFPSLQPFNPLHESRFQLDKADVVDIYSTSDSTKIQQEHKFKISVFIK